MGRYPDSVEQSHFRSEDAVNHEIGEGSSSDATPIIHVGKIIWAFVRSALFEREGRLDEMRLTDRALISCFRDISEPGRHVCRWSSLIETLGRHGRPCAVGTQPTVIRTDVPGGIDVLWGQRSHP